MEKSESDVPSFSRGHGDFWSKQANNFLASQEHVVGKRLLDEIFNILNQKKDLGDVVDFGCGTGIFTKAIAPNAKSILAIDISGEMLEMAKVYLKDFNNINYQKENIENSALPSDKFDYVLLGNIVHIMEFPLKSLQESYRILKAGGKIIVIDYTGYGMKKRDLLKMGIRFLKTYGKPPKDFRKSSQSKLNPNELTSLVEKANFKIEKIELLGDTTKALYLKGVKNEK